MRIPRHNNLTLRLPREDEEEELLRAHRATSPEVPSFLHKTIEKNDGILENVVHGPNLDRPKRSYWIELRQQMSRVLLLIIASFVFTLSLDCSFVQAQTQTLDQESLKERGALSTEQGAIVRNKRALITSEADTLTSEWVGTYSLEDGLTSGAQFDWAPANGFVVWWSTCSHGWRDQINLGSVKFEGGVLSVISDLTVEGEKVFDLSTDLIAVKWGEQHYLVPANRLIAFCYAARNAGRSLEINEFFIKAGDREKRRFGLPAVPLAYKKYLVAGPIQATIVEVKPGPRPGIQIMGLNVGRLAGIVPGMKLFAVSPKSVYMLVEVTEVREKNSEAYVITSGFKSHADKEVRLKVGWRLTSRAPRRAFDYYPG